MSQARLKKIILIPPNGKMFINDFSLQRIGRYFKNKQSYETVLIAIGTLNHIENIDFIHRVVIVKDQAELFQNIELENAEVIFHRSWMLAYPFAATLVEKFDNVIVNIKDWNFSSKKEYKFIFGEDAISDFKAIKYIFKNAKLVLSHFSQKQAKIWAQKYKVEYNKFIFFPEFCNKESFYDKKELQFDEIKLVLAGSLAPTSYPEELFAAKSHLRASRKVTKQGIDVSYVLTAGAYAATQSPKQRLLFQDVLYEEEFNDKFHLVKGKSLDASILQEYHFGFFLLEYSTKSQNLNKYTLPSKFAFYLESCTPMLINSKLEFLAETVEKHGLGMVVSNKELSSLGEKLASISEKEYCEFIKNIKKFRETFTYEKKLEKVIRF